MAQNRVQEEAAVQLQAMVMENIRETAEDLARLMESAETIRDPARGNFLDLMM